MTWLRHAGPANYAKIELVCAEVRASTEDGHPLPRNLIEWKNCLEKDHIEQAPCTLGWKLTLTLRAMLKTPHLARSRFCSLSCMFLALALSSEE